MCSHTPSTPPCCWPMRRLTLRSSRWAAGPGLHVSKKQEAPAHRWALLSAPLYIDTPEAGLEHPSGTPTPALSWSLQVTGKLIAPSGGGDCCRELLFSCPVSQSPCRRFGGCPSKPVSGPSHPLPCGNARGREVCFSRLEASRLWLTGQSAEEPSLASVASPSPLSTAPHLPGPPSSPPGPKAPGATWPLLALQKSDGQAIFPSF